MCPACLRPQTACICRWITPVDSAVELLILQHPMEVMNAKGSARLLHLCLPNSRLETGERFDAAQLAEWLGGERRAVLLYPETPGDASLGIPAAPSLERDWLAVPEKLLLVVLDATWRKSRKMLYLNPALQRLPRLALQATPPSHYLIRKAHAPDQLSTLEASAWALAQLENAPQRYDALIAAFDGFVAQQQAAASGVARQGGA